MMDAYLNYLWFAAVVVVLLTVLSFILWLVLWIINKGLGRDTWFEKVLVAGSREVWKFLGCLWVGITLFAAILTMISDFFT